MSTKAFIIGSGSHLPEDVVTNEDLAEKLRLNAERIFRSSGIRSRRWASKDTATSSLAVIALEKALENAAIRVSEVDYLFCGTMTPDRFIPGSAAAIQKEAGLGEIPCLDIRAACCNALYAMQLASALVLSGVARNVAICLAEIQSRYLDLTPEAATTSMLFGDGAAALIQSRPASLHRHSPISTLHLVRWNGPTGGWSSLALGRPEAHPCFSFHLPWRGCRSWPDSAGSAVMCGPCRQAPLCPFFAGARPCFCFLVDPPFRTF